MERINGRHIFSPTDLCTFMESRFASWMDRCNLDFPGKLTPDEPTEDQQVVMRKGIEHEKDFVAQLIRDGRSVSCGVARLDERGRSEVVQGEGWVKVVSCAKRTCFSVQGRNRL